MDKQKKQALREFAAEIRLETLKIIGSRGFSHVGGSMSMADAMAVLYVAVMNIDPQNPRWEAAQFAAHYKLDNLVCLVDDNKRQLDGAVADVMSHGKGLAAKEIKGQPTALILNTVKGKGATFAEPSGAHSSQPTQEQWDEAIAAAEAALAEIRGK